MKQTFYAVVSSNGTLATTTRPGVYPIGGSTPTPTADLGAIFLSKQAAQDWIKAVSLPDNYSIVPIVIRFESTTTWTPTIEIVS